MVSWGIRSQVRFRLIPAFRFDLHKDMYNTHSVCYLPCAAHKWITVGHIFGGCLLASTMVFLLTSSRVSGYLQTASPLPAELQLIPPANPSKLEPRNPLKIAPDQQYAGQLNAPAIVDKPTQDTDRFLQWALGVWGLSGVAAFATLCWRLWQTQQYSDGAITKRILKSIENGTGLEAFNNDPDPDAKTTVKRTALVAELKGFLRPQNMDTYGIVLGPHGSGKSTAIREALRSSGPQGAVYFMAPTSEEDTGCLSKLLDADRCTICQRNDKQAGRLRHLEENLPFVGNCCAHVRKKVPQACCSYF